MSLHGFGIKSNHRNLSQESLKSINFMFSWFSSFLLSPFLTFLITNKEHLLLKRASHLSFRISLTFFLLVKFHLIS